MSETPARDPELNPQTGDFDADDLRSLDDAALLRRRIERLRAANLALMSSLRYRIGDAFYRAGRHPKDFFLLPFRLVRLLVEGLRRSGRREGIAPEKHTRWTDPTMPPPVPKDMPPLRPVALFFAINGVGLGHLARCLAVARHLKDVTPVFVTTCRRAHVLDAYGIRYHYVPSPKEVVDEGVLADATVWNQLLSGVMSSLYDAYRPTTLVVDGVSAYAGLVQAWRQVPEIGRIGIRRGYRAPGRERQVLERDREYHLLLLPHAEGEEEIPIPKGPATDWVGPLVMVGRDEAVTREQARAELGIPADGLAVLVQLGAGVLGQGKEIERRLVEDLARRDVHVVVTSYDPALAQSDAARNIAVAHKFPMAGYFRAFDLAVAAAGYNTFHELMHHGMPTVFVPNAETQSDDQVGRARRAERHGAAIVVTENDEAGLRSAVDRLVEDEGLRRKLSEAAALLVPANGGPVAAARIEEFCRAIVARGAAAE